MELTQVLQLADNLTRLAKEFQTQEPAQASALKHAFKKKSHNDLARTVVYLMEVVGVSDMRLKTVMQENKDLREILELNNIKLGEEENDKAQVEETTQENSSTEESGQDIPATVSSDVEQDSSTGV